MAMLCYLTRNCRTHNSKEENAIAIIIIHLHISERMGLSLGKSFAKELGVEQKTLRV